MDLIHMVQLPRPLRWKGVYICRMICRGWVEGWWGPHGVEQMLSFVKALIDLTHSWRKNLTVQVGRLHDSVAVQQLKTKSVASTEPCHVFKILRSHNQTFFTFAVVLLVVKIQGWIAQCIWPCKGEEWREQENHKRNNQLSMYTKCQGYFPSSRYSLAIVMTWHWNVGLLDKLPFFMDFLLTLFTFPLVPSSGQIVSLSNYLVCDQILAKLITFPPALSTNMLNLPFDAQNKSKMHPALF